MSFIHLESERRSYRKFRGHKKGRVLRFPALSRGVRCYRTNLRARRPLPTKRTPAPSANSEAALVPPVGGSAFAFAGAGAGAAAGGGGGAGAAFDGGGGAGLHGALATTPPALASIISSVQSASAFAPPAVAVLALASATTAGSSWARAGEAASTATATTRRQHHQLPHLLLLLSRVFRSRT